MHCSLLARCLSWPRSVRACRRRHIPARPAGCRIRSPPPTEEHAPRRQNTPRASVLWARAYGDTASLDAGSSVPPSNPTRRGVWRVRRHGAQTRPRSAPRTEQRRRMASGGQQTQRGGVGRGGLPGRITAGKGHIASARSAYHTLRGRRCPRVRAGLPWR
ncbi:hypothetical protein C8Q78DRAFT_834226 [Trametes maxima]|nr:hypothetical protein C8Q78DRAFT_834226 [Trametes maxima]